MKTPLLLVGLVAWVALIVLVPPKPFTSETGAKPGQTPAANPASAASNLKSHTRPVAPAQAEANSIQSKSADPQYRDDAQTTIDAAVVTYSPAGVKAIRPYLLDADPEVRAAARDGLVQLGESDAVPLLRDAASKLQDPQEITSFREAADLLALPAWSDSEEAATVIAGIRAENEEQP
jgi:hypothetical protein